MIVTKESILSSEQARYLLGGILLRKPTSRARQTYVPNMPSQIDYHIKSKMAVSHVGNEVVNREYHSPNDVAEKVTSRRRVFVQTDTGSVLGIELDRADNAHTVKKKMQLALNVPTEESALTFGDLVLKNDLSVVRNDAALRLTRGHIHRSSSTPCLSPRIDSPLYRDRSGPLEIVGGLSCHSKMKNLIKQAVKAIDYGVDPIPIQRGLGGAYYFCNTLGKSIAIVKPTDEEPFAPNNPKGFVGKILGQPGLKRSIRVGETGIREVAAYLLDHEEFAKVPPTVLVKISHSVFRINNLTASKSPKNKLNISKIASFQQYVEHDFDANDHGTSNFSVAAVHRIGILDIRVLNTDRHAGNILVKRSDRDSVRYRQMGDTVELIPIDHGLCLPETLENPYFEWLHWPQASLPFSDAEFEYISRLDAFKDADMLRAELPMMREASLRILILCTIFRKTAAAGGLCLAEIGGMMGREIFAVEEEASELELVCLQAKIEADKLVSCADCELIVNMSEVPSEDKHLLDDHSEIEFPGKEHLMDEFQFDIEDGNDFQNGTVFTNNEKDDSYLNFAPRLDTRESGTRKLNVSQGTGLSLLLPQSSFPNQGKNDLQFHTALNAFCAIHALSPRISKGTAEMPLPKHSRGCSLAKLDEVPSSEEEEMQELLPGHKQEYGILKEQIPVSKGQFITARRSSFSQRNQCCTTYSGARKGLPRQGASTSRTMQSEPEPAMVAPNTIKFADMGKEEWALFIDCFQKILPDKIASRKMGATNPKHRHGASCQF
ncbi:hypothetical protein KI387_031350 [Taxus chinensis]|uniref:1-phosphatidylinositol 4-kinase n=1 Tax=Taxus chinensis TaxID=29808 RepID=A0AA38CJ02_TAXCH|nr:hypothetical protein KI387_031350 [Taxus chinensis]